MILLCIAMTQFFTCMAKMYVGRLRPNFYAMCGFDNITLTCTADEEYVLQARSSFPSGHSALSFGSMGCLVWYFLGRSGIGRVSNKCLNEQDKVTFNPLFFQKGLFGGKLGILTAFLPWIYASFVACSRLVDNWHHPSDIVAGSLIGIFCSTLAYHLW